jgi:hypothetical protein
MKRTLLLSLFACCIAATALAQGNNGLVAHWDFNGTTNDVSGHGLNGTAQATAFGNGYTNNPGKAIFFNGSTSKMDVPYNSVMNLDSFSICALVRPMNFYSGLCEVNTILSKGHETSSEFYDLRIMDNVYDQSCGVFSPNNEYYVGNAHGTAINPPGYWTSNTPTVTLNQWYCVTTTYSHDSIKLYVDGIFRVALKIQNSYAPSNSGISIGYYAAGMPNYPYYYNGYIDDIRLYNRPLSAQEAGMYCDSAKMIPTAVAAVPAEELLQVYPNPTSGNVMIQLPDGWKNAVCSVQNSIGQNLLTTSVDKRVNTVDIAALPAGIYLLRISNGEKTLVHKILKQ